MRTRRYSERAERACYGVGSLRELPQAWRATAFVEKNGDYCLKRDYREDVVFVRHDVRTPAPEGLFDLILCRNLAFTYFNLGQQQAVLHRLWQALVPGGALVIGAHETLPPHSLDLMPWAVRSGIYVKGKLQGIG
jgi:chemotaxis protein methyltransferase CheR